MANIKISELRPAGSELFQDSESFLNELNDQATSVVFGGGGDINISQVISQATASIGISIVTFTVVSKVVKNKKKD